MSNAFAPHTHRCSVCGMRMLRCCQHRWTMSYLVLVVTLLLLSAIMELLT